MLCGVAYSESAWKGIPFRVLPVSETHSRRVLTKTYPFWDAHHTKDLGRGPSRWRVRGSFQGPNFRDQLDAAKRIWLDGEPGDFLEPASNRTHRVRLAPDFKLDFSATLVNCVEFTLDFIEEGSGPYPQTGGGAIIRRSVDDLLGASAQAYRESFGSYSDAQTAMQAVEDRADLWARVFDYTAKPEFLP